MLQEMGESRSDVRAVRGVVQFLSKSHDVEDDASGCGGTGREAVDVGAAVEGRGKGSSMKSRTRTIILVVLFGMLLLFFGSCPLVCIEVRREWATDPAPVSDDHEEIWKIIEDEKKQKTKSKTHL